MDFVKYCNFLVESKLNEEENYKKIEIPDKIKEELEKLDFEIPYGGIYSNWETYNDKAKDGFEIQLSFNQSEKNTEAFLEIERNKKLYSTRHIEYSKEKIQKIQKLLIDELKTTEAVVTYLNSIEKD